MNEHQPEHGLGAGWELFTFLVLCCLAIAAVTYAAGWWRTRHRSPWPIRRIVSFYGGLSCAAAGLLGPIAKAAHTSFTAHMAGHLLLGMTAPLLLVLGAPITLALRALPVAAARSLSRVLRSWPVRLLTHPGVAALLNAGGLWVLYSSGLYSLMHDSVLVHALVHAHIFLGGYVLTASLVGVDPDPHRASMLLRSAVLVAFIAAHSFLAKWLYAHPPAGIGAEDAQAGAQLMYYGGDVIDVLLIVLLFLGWYRATRPRVPTALASVS